MIKHVIIIILSILHFPWGLIAWTVAINAVM